LGCITTGWWGQVNRPLLGQKWETDRSQLSDRWGRIKVMRFVIAGMLYA
jgi:hypothetical protein